LKECCYKRIGNTCTTEESSWLDADIREVFNITTDDMTPEEKQKASENSYWQNDKWRRENLEKYRKKAEEEAKKKSEEEAKKNDEDDDASDDDASDDE